MKHSPAHTEEASLLGDGNLEQTTDNLIEQVHSDQRDMGPWLIEKLKWWEARMSQMNPQGVHEPHAWASDIQLPVSDLYCSRIAAAYGNIFWGGSQTIVMQPANQEAYGNVKSSEKMMESILRGGGVHSQSDLSFQLSAAINSMVTYGVGLLKTAYSYKSRMSTEVLRRDAMPGILAKLMVNPGMNEEERREMQERFPGINPPEFQAIFGTLDVNPINKRVFRSIEPALKAEISRLFGFQTSEKEDMAALDELVQYFREGHKEPEVAITKREVLQDCPIIKNVQIQDLFVPPGAMLDFSRAERITERQFFSETQMREMGADERWNADAVERAIESGDRGMVFSRASNTSDFITQQQLFFNEDDMRTGDDNLIEVWEIYHYENVGPKKLRQLVVTTVEPNSAAVLRKEPFLPSHGQMPFSVLPFEVLDTTYRSPRGIPKMISQIEDHVNAWHRWLEDNMQISTSVSFAVNKDSVHDAQDIEWFPGMMLPVEDPSRDILPIPTPNVDVPIERMEQFLLLWPERLIGDLASNLSEGRPPERRTATEVATISANQQRMMDMRGRIFIQALERPLQQMWDLWSQFGPTSAFVHITGEEPVRLTQHQTRGVFRVKPFAAVGNMDPSVRQQQLGGLLDMSMQMDQMVQGDMRFEVDKVGMFVDFARTVDPLMADRHIKRRTQEEMQQLMQQREQEAQAAQAMSQSAQKALENVPMNLEEAKVLLDRLDSEMPHKGLQQIIERDQILKALAEQDAKLTQES